ncbi:PREDICTED: carbon catabolite repressor protein 4 homolog 1-like isoform X2 [Nelumbo nucifera]|uniref:poly(A)-specific ribonuclease n=2 Tax=Nelumbo nucifera TaxID=4432 RepID=A0A1U8AKT6_NELNU|nr:PREDICTED: carbon catabolite repressor protein 4 homolog 1-like isoform X2 [Nelumbo nucifera]DAD41139.1 TPA_asm: hypothetical protein HUJ06_015462 [Nelumbo nucifera]
MQCELRVSLPSSTPVVGVEIKPQVFPSRSGSAKLPDHSVIFNCDGEFPCCMHPSESAAFQCMCCIMSNAPVKESYYCSKKCFLDSWKNHHACHFQEAFTTSKTSNKDGQASMGKSSRSLSPWSGFDDVVDQDGQTWINVGSSKGYVPSMADHGYILRLECAAVDKRGNPLSPVNIILTDPVIVAPIPRPRFMIEIRSPEEFKYLSLEPKSSIAGTFSVLSYNILSDFYVNTELHGYCPRWALTWEYRRENLLREIVGYEADILCLQEVQSDHFMNFFEPELKKRGYSVIYKKKKDQLYTRNGSITDGCATFFRRDRFKEIKRYELEYGAYAHSVIKELNPSMRTEDHFRFAKDNVALVVIFELKGNDTVSDALHSRICVANTHIHANAKLTDVKLWQVATLIQGLEKIAKIDIPVLICGDLNSLPGSAPHNLLLLGKVDPNHPDLESRTIGILQPSILQHRMSLVSAYAALCLTSSGGPDFKQQRECISPETNEPMFTNFTDNFSGTLDYILYTADRLMVEGLLELLDQESLKKHTALPSPEWSSDHIALMAKFRVKPLLGLRKDAELPHLLW